MFLALNPEGLVIDEGNGGQTASKPDVATTNAPYARLLYEEAKTEIGKVKRGLHERLKKRNLTRHSHEIKQVRAGNRRSKTHEGQPHKARQ